MMIVLAYTSLWPHSSLLNTQPQETQMRGPFLLAVAVAVEMMRTAWITLDNTISATGTLLARVPTTMDCVSGYWRRDIQPWSLPGLVFDSASMVTAVCICGCWLIQHHTYVSLLWRERERE
eukprot:scpid81066/ scgid23497/ 